MEVKLALEMMKRVDFAFVRLLTVFGANGVHGEHASVEPAPK